eukprot:CAMPEP_0178931546 /NCGR_PEP_ID=MMETSP0786-20121207/21980_1 /TAXON_ID=186022 /ORGANISM="Thalassionema frauenfeldii, Strain CCMP 1798" /LENGTH=333 /DNA_ID=CAMNT_0020608455 /DNA_START=91 /DNA_END=1093 /DNA_ORIENTATION=+
MVRQSPSKAFFFLATFSLLVTSSLAWTTSPSSSGFVSALGSSSVATDAWFSAVDDKPAAASPSTISSSIEQLKIQLLQLGAALDRGQAYNPTSGDYYQENMDVARSKIQQLLDQAQGDNEETPATVPTSLENVSGEWELVLSTVLISLLAILFGHPGGYEYAETKTFEDGTSKPGLFFKLHELQTCSWGASKVGRIAQHIDAQSKYLYSTFDTSLFSLTVIPILGWFKLLPTFGGCVVTAATCQEARLDMVVDYTTSRKVEGLNGLPLLGDIIWKIKVPVGAIWKLLPWNKGRDATCKVYINYADQDFRIVQDIDGEFFVYTRPVVPRPLEII